MWKIRYNIAENKKIDYVKFVFFSSIVVVISLLFVILGIGNLWSSDKRVKEQNEAAEQNERELKQLIENTKHNEKDIRDKKKEWKEKVNFSNSLIKGKTFHITQELDTLEELLPEGVFITHMVWNVESQSKIQVNIAAQSLLRLIETYEKFSKKFNVVKTEETEDEGLFKASLILNSGSKKKK